MVLRENPIPVLEEERNNPSEELRELRLRVEELESRLAQSGQEADELFRALADATPVMLWMSGPDSLCTFFNRRWLQFRGRRMEQELGNGWAQGVHPDDLRRAVETYLRSFRERKDFQMEYRLLRADGEYRWVVDTGLPRADGNGGFAGFVGSAVEIQDRVRPVPENTLTGRMPLTDREKQVLILVAEGKSTKEVAAALGISYKTADSHRTKIMEKLGVHETASLVRWAIRSRLVQP